MNVRRWINIAGICTAVIACLHITSSGARTQEASLEQTLNQLLPGIGAERDFEAPQQQWQEICNRISAPGHETERRQGCSLMATKLASPTAATPAGRVWLLKQMERIGKEECVDAIAAAATDDDRLVRDAAIRALANNPAPTAGEKLRAALRLTVDVNTKVALVNALGFRAEPASTELLARELQSNKGDLAAAAARALGKLATPGAIVALKAVLSSTKGPLRLQVGDALAKCGERLLVQGNKIEARSIAELLYRPGEPARLAGLTGLLKASGDDAPAVILRVLASEDTRERAAAAGFVSSIDSKGMKQLADGLTTLPKSSQVALLQAFGARRDRTALSAVISAVTSTDQTVRTAALAALGGVGDRNTVPLLVQAIESGGAPADAARHSLETVFADGVDQALVNIMKRTKDPARRVRYIEILDHRFAAAAVPALLAEVNGDDGNVRRKAISALGNVAGPDDVPGMIRGLLKITVAAERDEAGRAIAAVCRRISDEAQQADPVLAEYEKSPEADQIVLLRALGRIGGVRALTVIRESMAASNPSRRTSGQEALLVWPDSTVSDDLAALAVKSSDKDLKARAIQALARLVVLSGPRSDDAKLALLIRAMKQADRNEERRLIIDRAREIQSIASVRFAASYIADPKLASQACATVVELLHRDEIRQPNQLEANKIIDQVIKISKDKSLVERAKSFKTTK
jgi:HEAT repeat protein